MARPGRFWLARASAGPLTAAARAQDPQDALPFLREPHDALRLGVRSLQDDATVTHPVEALVKEHRLAEEQRRAGLLRDLYGSALPTREHLEKQVISQCRRQPGLPCSNLALEALSGELDTISPEFVAACAAREPEEAGPSLHSQLERRLGAGTKAVTRGGL